MPNATGARARALAVPVPPKLTALPAARRVLTYEDSYRLQNAKRTEPIQAPRSSPIARHFVMSTDGEYLSARAGRLVRLRNSSTSKPRL